MSIVDDRVQEGAKFLDEKWESPQWRRRINIDELELSNNNQCIIGQLFGPSFFNVVSSWGLSVTDIVRMGFYVEVPDDVPWDELEKQWCALQRAWERHLLGTM